MRGHVDALVRRVTGLAAAVADSVRWASVVALLAALVVIVTLRAEPEVGFGWAFSGWWLLALAALVPAAVLYVFSRGVRSAASFAENWSAHLAGAADTALDASTAAIDEVRWIFERRRSLLGVAQGLWGLRGVLGDVRGLMGEAAPALATFSPGSLLATAAAAVAAVGLVAVAVAVVLLRILL